MSFARAILTRVSLCPMSPPSVTTFCADRSAPSSRTERGLEVRDTTPLLDHLMRVGDRARKRPDLGRKNAAFRGDHRPFTGGGSRTRFHRISPPRPIVHPREGPLLFAASAPNVILEPAGAIRRDIDVRFAADNQVGDDAAGRRAAAQSDVAVAECEIYVGKTRRRPDHR